MIDVCLNLTNCGITSQIIKSKIHLKNTFSNLSSLLLSFNQLGDDGVILITECIRFYPSLTSLDLGFNGIHDRGAEAIGKNLLEHPNLHILYLSGNSITNIGCSHLALLLKENHVLNRLYLAGNPITQHGAEALSLAILSNTSLAVLDLNSTNIETIGFSSISSTLVNEFLNITELNLGNTDCKDTGLQILANSLQYYRKLQILDLSFNNITEVGFEVLVTSLNQYPTLMRFSVSNNNLSDKSVKHLISMIQNINSLQELSIDYNGFSPRGILAIINSLSLLSCFHKPFLKLSLCGNSMNTESAKALAAFLTHSNGSTLHSLHLDHMTIGPQGEQQIAAAIASNQHCKLESITGLFLGPLMIELGSPPQLANFNNLQVLRYVKEMWLTYTQNNQNDQQNQINGVEYPDTDEERESKSRHLVSSNSQQQQQQQQKQKRQGQGPQQEQQQQQQNNLHNYGGDCDNQRQSIGRKRAASISNDPNENENENEYPHLTYSTNTQSEDDLTELADDVQTHIRTSHGPPPPPQSSSSSSSTPTTATATATATTSHPNKNMTVGHVNNPNTLAETSEETLITTEQIRVLMMKLEQIFDPILSEVAALPFDPSNLWTLHQYYYSPSNPTENTTADFNIACKTPSIFDPSDHLMEIETGQTKIYLSNTATPTTATTVPCPSLRQSENDEIRPNKRQSNRFTMTRIAAYPRIKNRLEVIKSTSEERLLTILRQLRCIEQYVEKYKEDYPYFIELDVESIILNRNGY